MSASPEYGGSTEPYEAIGASLRTQVRIILSILLILFLFLHFYSRLPLSSAPLTLSPTSGDSLHSLFFLLSTHLASELHGIAKTPLPSFLSGGQNGNVDRRKEYNLTLSEESGIVFGQKRI